MAAYSPRTDLLTPSVAPDTEGYGPGLTSGMNNFSRLMEMGITNQRQDDRDQLAYERKTGMVDRSEGRADQKDLMSKSEQSDFAAGAWESIKMRMPGIISPELNDRFMSGSLGAKQGLVLQAQAAYTAAMKSEEARIEDERSQKTFVTELPGTGRTIYGRGRSVMGSVDAFNNYGPAGQGYAPDQPYSGMYDAPPVILNPGPTNPNYFRDLPYAPRPIRESALGLDTTATGLPGAAPTAAPTPAPSRGASSAADYFNMGRKR